MQKKIILLLGVIIVLVVFLALFAVAPTTAWAILTTVRDAIVGFSVGVTSMIASNPIWINYGNYISFAVGIVAIGLVFWQGHNLYNAIRQKASQSAIKEAYGWQTAPAVTQPQPVTSQPTQTQPTPVPQQPQQTPPPPQEQPKS